MACRSAGRWPGALGWTRNRFLVMSIGVELVLLVAFLFIPSIAGLLGQAPPPAHGWIVAALAVPAVLGADALYKRWRSRSAPG